MFTQRNVEKKELIRREMYQYKLLGRLRDGSEYWVEIAWRNVYAEYIRED